MNRIWNLLWIIPIVGWGQAVLWAQPEESLAAAYARLEQQVTNQEKEPRGAPKVLEPYLRWLGRKAEVRNEVRRRLESLLADPSRSDTEDGVDWIHRFRQLLQRAQESGNTTTRLGASRLLAIETSDQWPNALSKLQSSGRPLYQKALVTDFTAETVRETARCLINFSLQDVEAGSLALYSGRELEFADQDSDGNTRLPDRDFTAACLPRSDLRAVEKGQPQVPADAGLEWVEQIREECRWWRFASEEADATDLMNQFYQDVLCRFPPKGHRWYRDLAIQYRLEESRQYNEGFYGTLIGEVAVVSGSQRRPADSARVQATAPRDGESWKGEADENGRYELKRVLLHKVCGPFQVEAEYGADSTLKTFEGPLTKPDESARHRVDLEIRKGDLPFTVSSKLHWDHGDPDEKTTGRASLRVRGVLRYSAEKSSSLFEWYEVHNIQASFSYQEDHLVPKDNCPDLAWRLEGGHPVSIPGSDSAAEGRIFARRMPLSPWGDILELHFSGVGPIRVTGEKREECDVYVPFERQIAVGGVHLRLPMTRAQGSATKDLCGIYHPKDLSAGYDALQLRPGGSCEEPTGWQTIEWNIRLRRQ